jgi:spore germination protein GerM
MPRQKSEKKPAFGVLFWIAFILFVAILYLANHQRIQDVLRRTDFVDVVFEERPESDEPDDTETEPAEDAPAILVPDEADDVPEPVEESQPQDDEPIDVEERVEEEEPIELVPVQPDPPVEDAAEQRRRTAIYFIRVTDDGRILAEEATRTVTFRDAPLTATIEALLAGPNADDLTAGYLSLIPQDTQLISARVENSIAFLNFNEAFRFNTMGLEGYMAQMQQVVLTATQFSTVDAVQILINGRRLEYLGGDGIYIAEPLTADDLRR